MDIQSETPRPRETGARLRYDAEAARDAAGLNRTAFEATDRATRRHVDAASLARAVNGGGAAAAALGAPKWKAADDSRRSAPELRKASRAGTEALAGLEARLSSLEEARSRLAAQGVGDAFGARNEREIADVRAKVRALRQRATHLKRAGELQRDRGKKLKHVF